MNIALNVWTKFCKLQRINRTVAFFACFYLIFVAQHTGAQEPYKPMIDIETFKEKLAVVSGTTQTIVCNFVQEKNLSVLSEKVVSKGQFFFKKQNNIRWEYTDPFKYLIIISNNQLYTRDDKNQNQYDIQSSVMFQEMNKFISGCVQGDILKNDKDYAITYFENSRSYYVKLIPRNEKMKQMLNEVQIYFDRNDLTVSSIKMIESGEDYTRINFIDKKLNTEIPVEKFNFK
jgi:outer membrane lipoprotein-sorting protein